MLASGAFMQVQSSLRWFVDNFSTIADWRATLLRVAAFRRAMVCSNAPSHAEKGISFDEGPAGTISIEGLQVASPQSSIRLVESSVTIKRGERVLIAGESGSGKTLFFRALAGLWPYGSGSIALPKGEEIRYMRSAPYMPPGTLRAALTYPHAPDSISPADCSAALARFGLERLSASLDSAQRWDRDLTEKDRQSLAFARVLVHKPAWLIMDDVFSTLEAQTLQRVVEVFAADLKNTGVIHIGSADSAAKTFTRILHLAKDAKHS